MADTISVSSGEGIYGGVNTSEIAFFLNDDWVVVPLPEFAKYHDGSPIHAKTAVYTWVPNAEIQNFIDMHRVSGCKFCRQTFKGKALGAPAPLHGTLDFGTCEGSGQPMNH